MAVSRNFSSKFLTFLLNAAGIGLPSQKHARYINFYKYYLLQAFILLTSAQVVLVRNLTTLAEITITLVFINNGIFLNSTTLLLHLKKKHIINILESINEDFAEINSFDTISSSVKFRKFFRSLGAPGVITYLLSLLSTVLLFPFSNKEYNDITALPIPSAFPWKVDNLQKYLLTIALQINWLTILSIPVALIFLFSIYYMMEIRVQYDILCKSIQQLNHSDEWLSLADNFDSNTEQKVMQSFNCCIQHHQKILKFSRNFNACYNSIFSMDLFYTVPNLALVLLSVAEEKSISSITRNVMTLAIITTYLLLFTSIGQTVQNANERFKQALYEVQWYSNKSIKFRKTFLIVQCSTQRILSLRASNKYVASYQLFCDILKLSYSYFNIMDRAFGR